MRLPWRGGYAVQIVGVEATRCSLFHRYVRLEAQVRLQGATSGAGYAGVRAHIALGGRAPMQTFTKSATAGGAGVAIVVEALIDPALFPASGTLHVVSGSSRVALSLSAFAQAAFDRNGRGALSRHVLIEQVDALLSAPAAGEHTAEPRRPRLLDLGGRRRSGGSYSEDLAQCDVTVFDIVADDGVDVVGDAHELSRHFPPGHFDFVMSVSVFEHLLMPWKVALELNTVMRTGAYCFIHTHQSLGMHELPWDFWRYSDTAWHGLFNAQTGFEVLATGLGHFMHLVTAGWNERYRGAEQSGGFESSGVLVRKVGPTRLSWDVDLRDAINTRYPDTRG